MKYCPDNLIGHVEFLTSIKKVIKAKVVWFVQSVWEYTFRYRCTAHAITCMYHNMHLYHLHNEISEKLHWKFHASFYNLEYCHCFFPNIKYSYCLIQRKWKLQMLLELTANQSNRTQINDTENENNCFSDL